MKKRIAINGFGRIGRSVFKNIISNYSDNLEVVAINDLSNPESLAHLLRYDSLYGIYNKQTTCSGDILRIDGAQGAIEVKLYAQKDPSLLPWEELGVDLVLECTGFFTNLDGAEKHLSAGAKKVIISAPSKDPEKIPSFILGVNEEKYNKDTDHVVDMGSCTTNCLAPIVKILDENYGIQSGMMTTIHSYTLSQNLLDGPHKDLRRARAAGINMIPTTTGATKAIGRVIPQIEGKISGMAVRVPTAAVSLVDLVCTLEKEAKEKEEINLLLKKESQKEELSGILGIEDAPLVSSDYIGNSYSSIVDADMTEVNGKMVKIISWYDNEWGYSTRLADFANYICKQL